MTRDMLRDIAQGSLDALGAQLYVVKAEELIMMIIVAIALGFVTGKGI